MTGREVEGGKFGNTWEKSVAWGKKALDEINFHRTSNGIAKLAYSDQTHYICFTRTSKMSTGAIGFDYAGANIRLMALQAKIAGVQEMDEIIGKND